MDPNVVLDPEYEIRAERIHEFLCRNLVWAEQPVGIREFTESPDYLGLKDSIYPHVLDLLELIESSDTRLAFVNLGKGSGKTSSAWIFLAYGIYRWCCLSNPTVYYGLMPVDKPCVINLSTGQRNAKTLIWHSLTEGLKRSPWFRGRYEEQALSLDFKNGITAICGHSSSAAFEGYHVLRGVLDEANKLKDDRDRVVADELFDVLETQARTRFPAEFKVLAISSSVHQDDFLTRKIRPVVESGSFVPGPATIERRPHEVAGLPSYGRDDFPQGQWRNGESLAVIGPTWVYSPRSPYELFAAALALNPMKPARDIGCRPPATEAESYVKNPEVIREKANPRRQHPVLPNGQLVESFKPGAFRYFMHFDLSKSRDSTGLAVGHWDGRSRICFDLLLEIRPPAGGEIQLDQVRQYVYALRDRGFNLSKVTYDGWNSVESIQKLNRHGVTAEQYSVDRTTEAYDTWLELLLNDGLDFYAYEPLYQNVKSLVLVNGKKVDHVPGGAKDVTDAMAAVSFHVTKHGKTKPQIF